jgi:hypothetical protein
MQPYGDRHVPLDEPIDLLNIAFENPRKIRVQVDGNVGGVKKKKKLQNDESIEGGVSGRYEPDYLVPDRSAGLSELGELRRLCPGRRWNFVSFLTGTRISCFDQGPQVEIDVPYTEYRAAQPAVKTIMWPCQTVMDLVSLVMVQLIFHLSTCVWVESCDGTIFCSPWCWDREEWPGSSARAVHESGSRVAKWAWL